MLRVNSAWQIGFRKVVLPVTLGVVIAYSVLRYFPGTFEYPGGPRFILGDYSFFV